MHPKPASTPKSTCQQHLFSPLSSTNIYVIAYERESETLSTTMSKTHVSNKCFFGVDRT